MKIYQDVLDSILHKMPVRPPEVGGIIGGKNGEITIWEFDGGYKENGCVYRPNVEYLNCIIAEWIESGLDFMGIFHVHFGGAKTLSKGDMEYIEKILKAMPDMVTQLLFPIVVQPEREMVLYVARINSLGEVEVESEEVEICSNSR